MRDTFCYALADQSQPTFSWRHRLIPNLRTPFNERCCDMRRATLMRGFFGAAGLVDAFAAFAAIFVLGGLTGASR
jgi:hypothetical protein